MQEGGESITREHVTYINFQKNNKYTIKKAGDKLVIDNGVLVIRYLINKEKNNAKVGGYGDRRENKILQQINKPNIHPPSFPLCYSVQN